MKKGDSIKYMPKVNYNAPKGKTSFGAKYVSELLNFAEQYGVLNFSDEKGQIWEIKKI
jgi:hypothetical protein